VGVNSDTREKKKGKKGACELNLFQGKGRRGGEKGGKAIMSCSIVLDGGGGGTKLGRREMEERKRKGRPGHLTGWKGGRGRRTQLTKCLWTRGKDRSRFLRGGGKKKGGDGVPNFFFLRGKGGKGGTQFYFNDERRVGKTRGVPKKGERKHLLGRKGKKEKRGKKKVKK